MGAISPLIPLLEKEVIIDSEMIQKIHGRPKAITQFIFGGVGLTLGILNLFQTLFFDGYRPLVSYGIIVISVILIVPGFFSFNDNYEYSILITNLRLIEQFTHKGKPQKVIDHHYEYFESTEVPFNRTKSATIPFQVILSSNNHLQINFPTKKLGAQRIYALINQIVTQSRNLINKISP
jgi:hypothetical protein